MKANALRIKKEKEEAKIIKKNKILEYKNKFESILNQVEKDLLNDGFVKRYNQILFTENSSKISKAVSGDDLVKSDIDGKLFFDDFPLEEILDKYQILAEDFIDARKVNNTTRILNINIEIESLLEPWDSMKDDCNSSEIINAMEKRISIANYMNRGK